MTALRPAAIDDVVFEVETIGDLEHEHDDDCTPCDRDECPHLSCEHGDGTEACDVAGCNCDRWIAYNDCQPCSGRGVLGEHDAPCRDCYGTGDRR